MGRRPLWLGLYVGGVSVAGAVGLLGVASQWGSLDLGLWELAGLLLLTGALDLMVVPLAGGGGVAASFAVLFAGLLVLGPGPTAWLAALAMVWSEGAVRRKPLSRVSFNAGHSVLSLLAAGWVYQGLGGQVGKVEIGVHQLGAMGAVVGAAGTLWLLETGWVMLAVALERGSFPTSGVQLWRRLHSALGPMLMLDGALASVGLLLALLYQSRWQLAGEAGWSATEALFLGTMMLIPCGLLYYAYRLQGDLQDVYAQSLRTLGALLEAKVEGSQPGHGAQVGKLAGALAQELELPPAQVDQIRYAGYLHDIGKVAVPSALLNRSRDQFASEPEPLRMHPEIGATILSPVHFLKPAAEILRAHHERWDGLGYPEGRSQTNIPLGARLLALANAYVGMTHSSAAPLLTPHQALSRLQQAAGSRFDPSLINALAAASSGSRSAYVSASHSGRADAFTHQPESTRDHAWLR
jgi:HD-GYP domain-containing protein (c-di-GMP phosphodiesterase class II)